MDAPLGTINRAAGLQLEGGCCGRSVLPTSWNLWVAPPSIFKLIEGGSYTTCFFNNGSLIYLTVFYLNLTFSLRFICCGICNIQCILPSDFGKLHLICGLLSDFSKIWCCAEDLMWFHETSSKWWVDHSHHVLVQSMGIYCCFCCLILNFYLETFYETFFQCFP